MAAYFDLVARPNQSIKSKATGEFIAVGEPPADLQVPKDWNVKPGDVLSWSDYRTTDTYFVTSEHMLLKNPDTSAAGYLTIPLSITSLFPDALDHFSSVLDAIGRGYVTSIELQPTDTFFAGHFSKRPLPASVCQRNDVSYSFDPNEDLLWVSHSSKPNLQQHFPLNGTKTDEIIDWISEIDQPRATFTVKYHFVGRDVCGKLPHGPIVGLPTGWQCEQQQTATHGSELQKGQWKCQGPERSKQQARQAIEQFYQGFSAKIEGAC